TVAMQYSPRNAIPYVSMVDAGTVELVRSLGRKVKSSADLVQKFEACWTPAQLESHLAAGRVIDRITQDAFAHAARQVRNKVALREYDLQHWILEQFRAHSIVVEEAPVVAVGPHSGDPHYEPKPNGSPSRPTSTSLLSDTLGKSHALASVYSTIASG